MNRLGSMLPAVLYIISFNATAYELGTHARITDKAYEASVLTTASTLFGDWGLNLTNTTAPFGTTYYEILSGSVEVRSALNFVTDEERDIWPGGRAGNSLSIKGWMIRGSVREDDYPNQSFLFGLCKIDDAPPIPEEEKPLSRPINHFYDPVNNTGITGQKRAIDWGLGADNALQVPNKPDIGRANHYTIVDAREAMYRALTGQASNGDTNIGPGGTLADESVRNAYWATTFRILGDVVHLVQDMGQPQHTRNDPHAGVCGVTGAKSVYEKYIEARAKGGEFITPGGTPVLPTPLNYTGYPIPQFNDYVSYFTTQHLDGANLLTHRGLADYSNRGFFSAGTNMFAPANDYSFPEQNPPAYGRIDVSVDWSGSPLPNNAKVELLTHTVPDTLTGETPSAALTSFGLWDQFLEKRSLLSRYTLTRRNYDDMANLLIPRTVAYSAGLINYFFRGRLETQHSTQNGELRVVVKNVSGKNNPLSNGLFEVFYDASDGTRKAMTVTSGAIVDTVGINDGELRVITATLPTDVTTNTANPFTLVYRGDVGNEVAVMGKLLRETFVYTTEDAPSPRLYKYSRDGTLIAQADLTAIFASTTENGSLSTPTGVAIDERGKIYVVDMDSSGPMRVLNSDFTVALITATPAGNSDHALGTAVDDKNIYMAYQHEGFVVVFDRVTGLETNTIGFGVLNEPTGIAVDDQRLYAVDDGNDRVAIFDKTSGNFVGQLGGGYGTGPGEFDFGDDYDDFLNGIAVDDTRVYVSDTYNSRIQVFDKSSYSFVFQFGSYGVGPSEFDEPYGIAVDLEYIYVADGLNQRTQKFNKKTGAYISEWEDYDPIGIAVGP